MKNPKLTQSQFLQVRQWIIDNKATALLTVEARIADTWDAGSRSAVYSAIDKPTFSACSLTEKVVMFEAWEMLRVRGWVGAELAELATA